MACMKQVIVDLEMLLYEATMNNFNREEPRHSMWRTSYKATIRSPILGPNAETSKSLRIERPSDEHLSGRKSF